MKHPKSSKMSADARDPLPYRGLLSNGAKVTNKRFQALGFTPERIAKVAREIIEKL